MIFELSRLFLKNTKKRLRPSDQVPDKGMRALVNKPAMGLVLAVGVAGGIPHADDPDSSRGR